MATRDVQYELQVTDEDLTNIRQESRSVLVDQLNKVKAAQAAHGRWVQIASYAKPAAASSAAKSLRDRFGADESQAGFLFRHKKNDDGRYGLFVRYTPDAIVQKAQAPAAAPQNAEPAKAKAS